MSPKQAKRLRKRMRLLSEGAYPLDQRRRLYRALKRLWDRSPHPERREAASWFKAV